ncbi:MAG TPA: hypothetical protein VII92_06345 [Anaerolineae bacterium]
MRKFWLTESGLAAFMVIMLIRSSISPLELGIGIALLLTPTAAANAMEWLAKTRGNNGSSGKAV